MTQPISFDKLVVVGNRQGGHPNFIDATRTGLVLAAPDGAIAVDGSAKHATSLEAIQDLMRQTGQASSRDTHENMAQGVREPIRQLARYKAWTQIFFEDWGLAPTEDNRIPLDNPIGAAFISSPEGRPQMITPGVQQWTRPNFFEISSGLEVPWNILKTAAWPVLRRRMEETADDMARRRDNKAITVLDTAVATVSGHTASASSFTKAAVDNFIKTAAQDGFVITQGAINPGRLMDMTSWTNGASTALPFFWTSERLGDEVYRQLYADGYGNIRWLVSYSVPMNVVWFAGEPSSIGYRQHHGAAQSASDVDIERRVDKHVVWEEMAFYVGNAYNLWRLDIV